jgi:hypothetical protein
MTSVTLNLKRRLKIDLGNGEIEIKPPIAKEELASLRELCKKLYRAWIEAGLDTTALMADPEHWALIQEAGKLFKHDGESLKVGELEPLEVEALFLTVNRTPEHEDNEDKEIFAYYVGGGSDAISFRILIDAFDSGLLISLASLSGRLLFSQAYAEYSKAINEPPGQQETGKKTHLKVA